MQTAKQIASKAKSNLTFALFCLPKVQREHMINFYAFCRTIDDIADSTRLSSLKKHETLDSWKDAITEKKTPALLNFHLQELYHIQDFYQIKTQYFLDIIEGCRSDISNTQRFNSIEDLKGYTYKVASCVGLVSIKILGCTDKNSEQYAIHLGHALQLTNILRDVGYDINNNSRIYLPLEILKKHKLNQIDIIENNYCQNFINMMHEMAIIADQEYNLALKALHTQDKKSLRAAESMRKIYTNILKKMRNENFKVFKKKYKISKIKTIYLSIC